MFRRGNSSRSVLWTTDSHRLPWRGHHANALQRNRHGHSRTKAKAPWGSHRNESVENTPSDRWITLHWIGGSHPAGSVDHTPLDRWITPRRIGGSHPTGSTVERDV